MYEQTIQQLENYADKKRRELKKLLNVIKKNKLQEIMKSFPKIIVDSVANEYVVCDERILTAMEEIAPVTVELANETSVTAKQRSIAELEVRGPRTVFCRVYCIQETKLNILSCS